MRGNLVIEMTDCKQGGLGAGIGVVRGVGVVRGFKLKRCLSFFKWEGMEGQGLQRDSGFLSFHMLLDILLRYEKMCT